jgi:hypothetical protein
MPSPKRVIATIVLAFAPALAGAWTPYGYSPYQQAPPDLSSPEVFDQGPSTDFGPMGPASPIEPVDRMGPPPGSQFVGMRIRQSATEQAYLLDIQLSGVKPADVKVEARGPWILVTRDASSQATNQETFSDGRGYRRSFSYSSGRASRRFNVPRDGDTAALQRQDSEDAIRIAVPRTRIFDGPR